MQKHIKDRPLKYFLLLFVTKLRQYEKDNKSVVT